jgi:hypothetical protein
LNVSVDVVEVDRAALQHADAVDFDLAYFTTRHAPMFARP